MADIIQLLPDAIANQIAAGEVIQRPSSAVKELLENAIDAKSSSIQLIIKEAGKNLIQVVDDGLGMSDTDARLSFERHATSKIKTTDDLFNITTKGFRGEALASIAAIAQVELKSKQANNDLGTIIEIDGSKVKLQENCAANKGTSIAIKNLFFNVPARRNFLKSNPVETKHIIDEFIRVALVHHDISFSFYNDGNEVYNLKPGTFRQRIVGIFGEKYNQRLVPVKESTDIVEVDGFVIKPEYAKRTRGEQFFFVNDRFIKNAYLNHAVQNAFEDLIQKDQFASYFLRFNINPTTIDINIHPTKTEIKFEDERSVYAIVRTSVKQALGRNNITPTLDFDQEMSFNITSNPKHNVKQPKIKVTPGYNPFEKQAENNQKNQQQDWEKLFNNFDKDVAEVNSNHEAQQILTTNWTSDEEENHDSPRLLAQLHNKYILAHLKSGFLIIDQSRAHQRILYEQFIVHLSNNNNISQQLLFPQTIAFSKEDIEVLNEIKSEIIKLGFNITISSDKCKVTGVPIDVKDADLKTLLESFIEQFKNSSDRISMQFLKKIAATLAFYASIKPGKYLSVTEMNDLVDNLFTCENHSNLPNGKPITFTFSLNKLDKQFEY